MSDLIERAREAATLKYQYHTIHVPTILIRMADEAEEAAAELARLHSDIANDLRGVHSCHENCQRIACVQRREIARLTAEVERLQRERAERNKTDPVTRLHNLCDAMAEDCETSPYSQQAWDAQDEAYREKCKEVEALRADAEKWRAHKAKLAEMQALKRSATNAMTKEPPHA